MGRKRGGPARDAGHPPASPLSQRFELVLCRQVPIVPVPTLKNPAFDLMTRIALISWQHVDGSNRQSVETPDGPVYPSGYCAPTRGLRPQPTRLSGRDTRWGRSRCLGEPSPTPKRIRRRAFTVGKTRCAAGRLSAAPPSG